MKIHAALASPQPLLIEPQRLKAHADASLAAMAKDRQSQPDFLAYVFGPRPQPEIIGNIAVIPVKGIIAKGLSDLDIDLGAIDLEDLSQWLDDAEANPNVSGVLLDFDTPGGIATGVPEVANRIRAFAKPIVAFTGGMCCSAGYWLASAAQQVIATPSANVGSIGVYIAFPDVSAALRAQGITMEVIKSGDLKGAGIPGTSLTDAQRADLQDGVDELHADFKSAVLNRRTMVQEDSMRGQSFSGRDAASRGLVTGLVNSRAEAIAKISTSPIDIGASL